MTSRFTWPAAMLTTLLGASAAAADLPFVNWENFPLHPMDISPDGRSMALTHTADNRIQLFDVSEGRAVQIGHVVVGVDPLAVRFRTDTEIWVVNHVSDTISIVDIEAGRVIRTLETLDEPADVVFAGSPARAFVSCSQANTVMVFDPEDLEAAPTLVPIDAEDPRSLAVSPDGQTVYAAIFESGNGTTLLGGGSEDFDVFSFPPNVTRQTSNPYGGQNPPPNSGNNFEPPMSLALPAPPQVAMIVRKDEQGRWLDDNGGDWSQQVSGRLAFQSGRISGWDLPDRDIAVIDTQTLTVSYASRLLNIGMSLAVNPATGAITLIGTDATNEVRYEPNLNGRFVRVNFATVNASDLADTAIADLNDHLDYQQSTIAQSQRDLSIGDPRALVWQADGQRGFVAGMGSNNILVVDANGQRLQQQPLEVGEGPLGLALDENHGVLYAWNHFESSLSTIALDSLEEMDRQGVFNPLPEAISQGRGFFYGTHETSGLGQLSCASCHIDGRIDRLAWDLGDPSGSMRTFNQNCTSNLFGLTPCEDHHPMKGPMMTQTFQDIIGHEPFHWRGDRDGLHEFNGAFQSLLGDDTGLSSSEMNAFKDFVSSLTVPANPFRNFDNSLPSSLDLEGHFTIGRFGPAGQPLGTGNAERGLDLYVNGLLDDPFHCGNCHTLPTGMAVNGPLLLGSSGVEVSGQVMPMTALGENHLGINSVDGVSNVSIKVPQLRNLYEKVGFDLTQQENRAGFGFSHDGGVDSLARFIGLSAFEPDSSQDIADLVALMLAFSGSDFDGRNSPVTATTPQSKDTHAAVGAQLTLSSASAHSKLSQMINLAREGQIGLIAHSSQAAERRGWAFDQTSDRFLTDDDSPPLSFNQMLNQASASQPLTFTAVPKGLGQRLGIDRDGDDLADRSELKQGSNPADSESTTLRPSQGLWFNPARSGHGFDLQLVGEFMFITWYTYNDDGTPTWYQALAPFAEQWTANLSRFVFDANSKSVVEEVVGTASLSFSDASNAQFDWQIGERPGSEAFQLLALPAGRTVRNYTGTWFDPSDSGWGLSFYSGPQLRVGVMYFYDVNNQPRWVLGTGENTMQGQIAMGSFSGFCPDCAFVEAGSVDGGQVEVLFDTLRTATFSSNVNYPGLAGSSWERSSVGIIPLSDPAVDHSTN